MFKTTTRSGTGRNQRNNPYILDDVFLRIHHSTAGIAWRWRTELMLLIVTVAALWRLALLITVIRAAVALAGFVLALMAVPVSRRFLTRRFWCVLGRHRLQRLCYEARLHTRAGRIPLVLWTRPTKVGERARILCRAGICADDFTAHAAGNRRRLLRPRSAGHPQPEVVAPGDHRRHPPRHPRGQPIRGIAPARPQRLAPAGCARP